MACCTKFYFSIIQTGGPGRDSPAGFNVLTKEPARVIPETHNMPKIARFTNVLLCGQNANSSYASFTKRGINQQCLQNLI